MCTPYRYVHIHYTCTLYANISYYMHSCYKHTCRLIDKWILALKLELAKMPYTDHRKLEKKDDQNADVPTPS